MQLPLSADVVVPVGVGVLVAVVAVIALVIGLRRKVEDAPTPTDADWTREHVGDVVVPPTRTVADAVAERQGNTGPFVVVAPAQKGAVEARNRDEAAEQARAGKRNGRGRGSRGAVPLSALGPVVSASVVARQRRAVQASARSASVALAEPNEAVAGVEATPKSTAVEGSAAHNGLRAQAGHVGSGGEDDRAPFPADPLFGAGRFDQVGPDGDPWFTPPAIPRTPVGGPGSPPGPEEVAAESQAGEPPVPEGPERATDPHAVDAGGAEGAATPRPSAERRDPTMAADPAPAHDPAAENSSEPAPESPATTHRAPHGPGEPARHPSAGLPDPTQATPSRPPAAGLPGAAPATPARYPAAGLPEPGTTAQAPAGRPQAGAPTPPSMAPPPEPDAAADVPESAAMASESAPASGDGAQTAPAHRGQAANRSDAAPAPDPHVVANVPEPASAPEDGPAPTRYPVVNVPEPAPAPDRHPVADEPAPAAGSSHSVAAAVAQVLAARAAAHAPEGDRRGDARDRLLAVLLDDPMRAVGAAVDLQDCQERLDRLAASLQDERGRLGDVLGRLSRSGLRPDQLARLSGLSDIEVAELLRRGPSA
jgi:hypothetical protein